MNGVFLSLVPVALCCSFGCAFGVLLDKAYRTCYHIFVLASFQQLLLADYFCWGRRLGKLKSFLRVGVGVTYTKKQPFWG